MTLTKLKQIMQHEKFIAISLALICFILLANYLFLMNTTLQTSSAMMVSVSSDGHYVVSSHLNGEIMLWDIADKTQQKIADHANCYSAYFIKNTHYFMWQDLKNTVHIQDINGKTLLLFQNRFPVYGQVMTTDLKHYFASDQSWNLFMDYGDKQKLIKSAYGNNGFLGAGKLFNLTLSQNNQFLLTSGDAENVYDVVPLTAGTSTKQAAYRGYSVGIVNASLLEGVTLWDVNTGRPLVKFPGNEVKTFATFSPDDFYVVTGDENQHSMIWQRDGKKYLAVDIAIPNWPDNINIQLLKNHVNAILSLKFIDNDYYLRFTHQLFNYVALYRVDHIQPEKLIFIENDNPPAVNDFSRDEAIDTAPQAHILAIGQASGSGINVYRYNPAKLSLERIWVTTGPAAKRVALNVQ